MESAMSRYREPRHGDGGASLVAAGLNDDFYCYWYAGPNSDRLAERARVASVSEALAWGRLRTARVRIMTSRGRTYWAGSAATPEGFNRTWRDAEMSGVGSGQPEAVPC
jgi:hypothetical protein